MATSIHNCKPDRMLGFAAASHQRYQPYLNVIISEEVRPIHPEFVLLLTSIQYNNTLNQDCPNAEDGSREIGIWLSIFGPPISARLNKAAPGANLNATHVLHLLAMCPFESVAKETMSPFCAMFNEDDFRAFEYYGDLEKYYRTGCVAVRLLLTVFTQNRPVPSQPRKLPWSNPGRRLRERAPGTPDE